MIVPLIRSHIVKTTLADRQKVADFMIECLQQKSFRCACCLNHHYLLANIGLYKALSGATVAYGVCKECMAKVTVRKFLDRCESYREGAVNEQCNS